MVELQIVILAVAGSSPVGRPAFLPSEVTHQIKYQQNDQDEAETAAAAGRTTVGVSAAATKKDKDNNDEDQGHGNKWSGDYFFLSAGEGN